MSIPINTTQTVTATIRDVNGVVVDPTVLTITFFPPTGSPITYTYGTDPELVRTFVGAYQVAFDFNVASPPDWTWTWTAVLPNGGGTVTLTGGVRVLAAPVAVTVNFSTPGHATVSDVLVQVFSSPLIMVASGYTDGSGNVVFNLMPGTYDIEAAQSKTSFSNPYAMVVTTSGTFDFVCTPLTIGETATPTMTRLFGHIVGGDGQPSPMVRVVVEVVGYGPYRSFVTPGSGSDASISDSPLMVKPEKIERRTDSSGYFECDVVQGSLVRIEIPAVRYARVARIPINPNNPTQPLLNFRDLRPDPGPGGNVGVTSDTPDQNSKTGPG